MGGCGVNTEKSLYNSGLQKALDTGTSLASSATLFDEAHGNHIKVWLRFQTVSRLSNMRTVLVQRSPNLCPKIYVVLYFVSTQIDRMYISEDQSSECDDN